MASFSGHVKARPKAVFEALDARLRPGDSAFELYTADAAAFFIIAQGGWWYRGEYGWRPTSQAHMWSTG